MSRARLRQLLLTLIAVNTVVVVAVFVFRPPPHPPLVQVEKERLLGQVVNSPQRILREVADQQQALDQVIFSLLLLVTLLPLMTLLLVLLLLYRCDNATANFGGGSGGG